MPSFLNKVFGRKKQDEQDASQFPNEASDNVLLDGKYEAISPVLSPSTIAFAEAQANKDKERDHSFSLFRPKSRVGSSKPNQKCTDAVPQLSLHLPGPKENFDSRALGVVFEADPDAETVLDHEVIGARRLNPLEALILVRVCAQAITERGLETLGIMHPHWFSASPDFQRKLISLFIHSLAPKSRITTLSPTPTSATSTFETEIGYARSPHDVAAVLRWGLRHLKLENGHFGKDTSTDEWAWYKAFFTAERDLSYPPKAFTDLLLPQLPTAHIELLLATLDVISALAAHAEANSISGCKLSKFLGLWLLTTERSEETDDWFKFYARWERAGRILEHLFLSRLRQESLTQRLPTRLQELTKHYPYNKGTPVIDEDLLPPPRFSTRKYDALLVRVESLISEAAQQPKQHPIRLILEAFQLQSEPKPGNEHLELWNTVKTTSTETSSQTSSSSTPKGPQLTRVFVDETIQLLSMIPADSNDLSSSTLIASPIPKVIRRRSSSLSKILERRPPTNGASTTASPTTASSPVITDWAQFSTSGFGDISSTQPLTVTLLDQEDTEVTQPPVSRKSSSKRGTSRRRGRSPSNGPKSAAPTTSERSISETAILETKLASVDIIQLDEAFIDFWSDAIVDPITASWPTFVICGLKPIPGADKPVQWLVIEQTYVRQQPTQSHRATSPEAPRGRTSPRPSFRSDISAFRLSSTFASTRKRFSIFSKSTENVTKKATGKSPKVGELGEILAEEEEKPEERKAPVTSTIASNGVGHVQEVATSTAATVTATKDAQPQATEAIPATPPSLPTVPITAPPPDAEDVATKQSVAVVPVEIGPTEPSREQDKVLSEKEGPSASVQIPAQPISGNVDGSLLANSDGAEQTNLLADKEEGSSGQDSVQFEGRIGIDANPEPGNVAGNANANDLPPAPENVVLAGETPGPQVALDTSEPVALTQIADEAPIVATSEGSVATDELGKGGDALTATAFTTGVSPGEEPHAVTAESAPADILPEMPVIDATAAELPVAPTDQPLLVHEPVTDISSVSEPVSGSRVVPATSSAAVDVVNEPVVVSAESPQEPAEESPLEVEPAPTNISDISTEPHSTEVPAEPTVVVDEVPPAEQTAAEAGATVAVEASDSAEEPATSDPVSGAVVNIAEPSPVDVPESSDVGKIAEQVDEQPQEVSVPQDVPTAETQLEATSESQAGAPVEEPQTHSSEQTLALPVQVVESPGEKVDVETEASS